MGFNFATLNSSSTISDINDNFALVEAKIGNIKNSDIAEDAGITSQKLADRYVPMSQVVLITANQWGSDSTTPMLYQDTDSSGSVSVARIYPEFPGKRASLVSCNIYVNGHTTATDDGAVFLFVNSTLIDQKAVTASGLYNIRAGSGASAFAAPIATLIQGDYIGLGIGKDVDTGTGRPSFINMTITLTYKVELTS